MIQTYYRTTDLEAQVEHDVQLMTQIFGRAFSQVNQTLQQSVIFCWQALNHNLQHQKYTLPLTTACTQNTESVFHEFPRPFCTRFRGPAMPIYHVFPGLFNRVDIKQVRFLYTFTKSITLCMYMFQRSAHCYVDNDNVFIGRKHAHGSKMRQPFGTKCKRVKSDKKKLSWCQIKLTFHDLPGLENLNF